MKRVALATVILSAIALTISAQEPFRLSGRVVADDTGDPLSNARVTVTPPPAGGAVVLTDREGRFSLPARSPTVKLTVSKTGYGPRDSGEISAASPVVIRLERGVAISGRVVDPFGDPVFGGHVVVETKKGSSDEFTVVATADTDDRGEYRMGSLTAGVFRVAVLTRGAMTYQDNGGGVTSAMPSMLTTYYPAGTAPADAQMLRFTPGEDRSSINFAVPAGQTGVQLFMMYVGPSAPTATASPQPTGVVRGRIVATDGRAVPRAEVRLMQVGRPPPSAAASAVAGRAGFQAPKVATSDADGRYEFVGLGAGAFRITATKIGYSPPGSPIAFGPAPPIAGLPVVLAEGETRERADVTLAPWGTLSGRVLDEWGEPIQGVSVQLMQVRFASGRRRLVGAGAASSLTDDLGRFRTFGMAPGNYVVSAVVGSVGSADLPGYTRSYFPGTSNAGEAQFVSIGVAQEITGIDFSLERTHTARVSGTLLNAAGLSSTQGSVRLVTSQRAASATSTSIGARLMPDGRFEFPNVTPGQYVIQVDRGRRGSATEGEFGVLPVSVNGVDITDLVLQTSTGSSIGGRVTFESSLGAAAPQTGVIYITTVPTDPDQAPTSTADADVHPDWSFLITGIHGPRRIQVTQAPAGWSVREIRAHGIEVTDRPIAFGRDDQSLNDVEIGHSPTGSRPSRPPSATTRRVRLRTRVSSSSRLIAIAGIRHRGSGAWPLSLRTARRRLRACRLAATTLPQSQSSQRMERMPGRIPRTSTRLRGRQPASRSAKARRSG